MLSHVASPHLLSPLLKAQFVLGLHRPLLVKFLACHKLLDHEHLLDCLVDEISLVLTLRMADPLLKRLLLAHRHSVLYH